MTMKAKFRAAAYVVGWAMILACVVLMVALVADIAWHVIAREAPVVHLWLWAILFGLGVLGVLLVQTGEMAEALETLGERLPGLVALAERFIPRFGNRTGEITPPPGVAPGTPTGEHVVVVPPKPTVVTIQPLPREEGDA